MSLLQWFVTVSLVSLCLSQADVTSAQQTRPSEESASGGVQGPRDTNVPALSLADLALRSGIGKLATGDVESAIDILRLALQGQPDNPVVLTALADAYVASASDDAVLLALDLYEEALVVDPKSTHAREGLARACWMAGETDRALDQMESLYLTDGDVVDEYAFELATYYMLGRRIDRGLHVFAEALPKSTKPHATMLLIASMLMQKHDKRTAGVFVHRVLRDLPPDDPLAIQAKRMLDLGVGE